MAKYSYEVKTPEGVFDVDSETELTPEQAYSYATGKPPSAPKPKAPAGPSAGELAAEGMPWWEKGLVGAGGGLRRTYLGAKDLIGQGTAAEAEELKDWEKNKGALGGWGTGGEILGELAATAVPGAGGAGLAAKGALKMFPELAKVAQMGGRSFNLGTAGRAGVEGAISAGIMKPGEGETRLGNAAQGGTIGAALPLATAALAPVVNKTRRELSPFATQSNLRGSDALERTLGKGSVEDLALQLENAGASQLPRTVAAITQDPSVGALERGARFRNVDAARIHEANTARAATDALRRATPSVDELPGLRGASEAMMQEGHALLDKLPLSKANRDTIGQELLGIRNSNEALSNKSLQAEINHVLGALDNPSATLGVLSRLHDELGEASGPASQRVRDLLKEVADERSGGQFTNMLEGRALTAGDLESATAAQALRGKFGNEATNIPRGTVAFGETGTPDAFSSIGNHPLREALAAQSSKMRPDEVEGVSRLADDLAAHEIYKPLASAGDSGLDMGSAQGMANAGLNASVFWRLRGALGPIFGGLNKKSQQAVDEAIMNPEKFLKMADLRLRSGRPLEKWEADLQQLLRAQSREVGSASAGEE